MPPALDAPKAPKRHMRLSPKVLFKQKYNASWRTEQSDLDIELACIRLGGRWISSTTDKECGLGLEYHYKQLDRLLWPEDVWDEWDAKLDRQLCKGGVQGLVGPAAAGKTNRMSKFALRLYWAFPIGTTIVVSTTTIPDLENRIWGAIVDLYNRARERYPDLPGRLLDSKHCIVTEQDEREGRDFRSGIKGRACRVGEKWVGLGPYVGIHGDRVVIMADEAQLMPPGYFDVAGNLSSNRWWLLAASGNPNDPTNSFGHVCEPKVGWDLLEQGMGDQVWESRTGEVLRLDGLTAPNLEAGPGNERCKNKITHKFIEYVRSTYGEGSWQWEMWVRARFIISILEKRLFVRKFAERFHSFDEPEWADDPLSQCLAIDAAYGAVGGDKCVAHHLKWGRCTDGKQRLAVKDSMLVPVKAGGEVLPEHQIVSWTKEYCERFDIPARRVGFDSTGRGSLVSAFGTLWSSDVVAIEFGGGPTDRPDPQNPKKLSKDSYGKFVSEMAFALKACIESDQFRALPLEVALQAEMRAWANTGKKGRQDVETKDETRERIKRSPDDLDSCIAGVELARRLGFVITKAEAAVLVSEDQTRWLKKEAEEWQEANDEAALDYDEA